MKEIIGKKAFGFEFKGEPSFATGMKKYIGVEGTITDCNNHCKITFHDNHYWYPYPEILNHLVEEKVVEEELTVEEILNNIKNLIPNTWKQKI